MIWNLHNHLSQTASTHCYKYISVLHYYIPGKKVVSVESSCLTSCFKLMEPIKTDALDNKKNKIKARR